MKILNKLFDNRIQAYNILLEITIEDYFELSQKIIDKNQFQRRRVKSSSTVYRLLKNDLKIGCIIPPIVLALSTKGIDLNIKDTGNEKIIKSINDHLEDLIILDGLQRTYTIRDLIKELEKTGDGESLEKVKKGKIRIEIYVGINKLGILYRMLTLNTGQTPMSIRHQIEILYSDYLTHKVDDIQLLLEADDKTPRRIGEYKFKEIIEGFNSYVERKYLSIDRSEILENIETLEKLSAENQDRDIFVDYLKSFHHLVETFISKSNNWEFNNNEIERELSSLPFGKNAQKIFSKSQVMTGFGSALGKLIDFTVLENINSVNKLIDSVNFNDSSNTLNKLIIKLDQIRIIAKKIGNDQRMFFHFLFRELFDKKSEAFLDLDKAIDEAYSTYLRKTQ